MEQDPFTKAMTVTLEQIARKVGMGKATVSRALRKSGSISEKTRTKILQAAEEMGYRPDPILSAFTQRRWDKRSPTGTPLAFVFSSENDAFSSECLRSAELHATALGYHLSIYRLNEFASHAHASRVLFHRGVRGLILGHQRCEDPPLKLEWDLYSVVACGLRKDHIPASIVMPNVFNGMRLCRQNLQALGYCRPGVVFMNEGPDDNTAYQMGAHWNESLPLAPFLQEIPSTGIPALTEIKHFSQWFQHHRPDVILGSNLELFDALTNEGWQFPKDVPYVCFGWNNRLGKVAGIDLHTYLIGVSAVDLLDAQIRSSQRGVPAHKITHMIEPTWVAGETLPKKT